MMLKGKEHLKEVSQFQGLVAVSLEDGTFCKVVRLFFCNLVS